MNLPIFTIDAYNRLKADAESNLSKYLNKETWLDKYFENETYYKESSVYVPKIILSTLPDKATDDEKNITDLSNVQLFYGKYKDILTPQTACNYLMWSALSHLYYQNYIVDRWQKDTSELNITGRFFATKGRVSLIYYNAVSRLWWCGYITYDETNEKTDPYHLTKILLSAQQIYKDFTDTSYSTNKIIAKGVLLALKEIKIELGDDVSILKCFREFNKYFNHYGAVTILDFLSEDEIKDITLNYMRDWFKKSK